MIAPQRSRMLGIWFILLAVCAGTGGQFASARAATAGGARATSSEDTVAGSRTTDPSLAGTRSLLQVLRAGGPILIPIGGCSFLLCVFVFERVICLRAGRVIPGPFVKRFIDQLRADELQPAEALRLCQENVSPVAEVFAAAIKKWGRTSVEVEQAVLDTGERVANRLRKYLRLFHGISTVCPLLGLLGTVFGMIGSFTSIATSDAMGKPELLAAGISEALITTAAGLTVAIPALVAHLYFVGRVDRLVMEIDSLGQEIVNLIAIDGWREVKADNQDKSEKKSKLARPKAA